MDGILIVDKPEGTTSAAIVARVRHLVGEKVGHLGTLDPFASGVLPLCIGAATRIAQFLSDADKTYEGTIQLGARTQTGDCTGKVVAEAPVPLLDPERWRAIAAAFRGERLQVPPMYSALKRAGTPLYKLARRGITVERAARRIWIRSLELEPQSRDRLRFRVQCSKGTYIRVLAEEIGSAAGTLAYLAALRRTRFGPFGIGRATPPPSRLEEAASALISCREALEGIPELVVDAAAAARIRQGQPAILRALPLPPAAAGMAKIVGPDGALLAVLRADFLGQWRFARVLR